MIEATCHCGAVRMEIDEPPEVVTDCNCSLCHRKGALWAYYRPAQVRRVAGDTVAYVQGDRTLETHHCPSCGCTTHWQSLDATSDRMAVNARLMPPQVLAGLRVERLDGADTWDVLGTYHFGVLPRA
jgi:hypothetical protein